MHRRARAARHRGKGTLRELHLLWILGVLHFENKWRSAISQTPFWEHNVYVRREAHRHV